MIRVAIVDDVLAVRSGLRTFLSVAPDMEVAGDAANGQEALALIARVQPHVVLMDVEMPVLDGVAATKEIRATYPNIHIILLTMFDNDHYVLEGLKAGAQSYLLKDAEDDEIIGAIRAAAQGQSILHPRAATRVVAHLATKPATHPPASHLTQREREILRLVALRLDNQEIATRLAISVGTVKIHLHHVYEKLQLRGRHDLQVYLRDRMY